MFELINVGTDVTTTIFHLASHMVDLHWSVLKRSYILPKTKLKKLRTKNFVYEVILRNNKNVYSFVLNIYIIFEFPYP